jgi:pimeloyl-ACP methyl ester carboxylesterase
MYKLTTTSSKKRILPIVLIFFLFANLQPSSLMAVARSSNQPMDALGGKTDTTNLSLIEQGQLEGATAKSVATSCSVVPGGDGGASGRVLVLLQGLGSKSQGQEGLWDPFVWRVSPLYSGIVYFSYSGTPNSYTEADTRESIWGHHIVILHDLIDACRADSRWRSFDLVGHSQGGVVATEYIRRYGLTGNQQGLAKHVITLDSPVNGSSMLYKLNFEAALIAEWMRNILQGVWLVPDYTGQSAREMAANYANRNSVVSLNLSLAKELGRKGTEFWTLTNYEDFAIPRDDAIVSGHGYFYHLGVDHTSRDAGFQSGHSQILDMGNFTEIRDDLYAILSRVSQSGTPTPVPTPTRTPTAGPGVDKASFISDVNYPDGSVVNPGQAITKIWRMKNTGTSTWASGYKLVFRSGNQLGASSEVNVPTAAPNQTVDISVPLNIPANLSSGSYRGDWQFRNPQGTYFGDPLWYILQVSGTQPPTGNSVNVELTGISLPNGGQVTPGQTFQPQVTVKVTAGQLLQSRGDLLKFYSGTNYTSPEFPHVAVAGTINNGQSFTFTFYPNNPFRAPNSAGTYESRWRVWANNAWAGPEVVIRFSVYTSAGGRPPNPPTLTSPGNWTVFVAQQPTMCAQHNGDPDGDSISGYRFVVFDSTQNYDSGWVSGNCVTPGNFGNYWFKWHAKVRDSRGTESDWSEERWFTKESSTVTVTDYHFEPASPSAADPIVVRVSTSGCAGIGVNLKVSVNTAADGSTNGEWRVIGNLGVPQFNDQDAPRWQTHEYEDGDHIVRLEVTSCDNTIQIQDRHYTLLHRKPGVAYPLSPPCYQPWAGAACDLGVPSTKFWSNSRTVFFSWKPALRASDYTLVVGTTDNPNQSTILRTTLQGTSYTATFDQDYPTLYWQVWANNELGSLDNDRWWFGIDRTPPSSSAVGGPAPSVSYENQFSVVWAGSDNASGSGIQSYDVQFKDEPAGAWTDWLSNHPYTSAIFTAQPGHTYSFRTRARDVAGNVEAYPASTDTQVWVDPTQRPPQLWWDRAYTAKRTLVVANRMNNASLPSAYPVQLHFDGSTVPTAADIYNASATSTKGNDVRVVYNETTEIPRYIANFAPSSIDIWFATQADIPANATSSAYTIYYQNAAAGVPSNSSRNILVPGNDAGTRMLLYFDESSGSTAYDSSDYGNHGTLQGSFPQPWSTGWLSNGLYFGGSSLVKVPDNANLHMTNQLTVEAWVRPTVIDNDTHNIVSKISPSDGFAWRMYMRQGEILFHLYSEGYDWGVLASGRLEVNKWYHLAGVYDGNTARLYINGVLVKSDPYTRSLKQATAWIAVGGTGYYQEYFVGSIDQVRVSAAARTSFPYAAVSINPSAAAGQQLTQETIGPSDLALRSLEAFPNPDGGILLQAVFENVGEYPTYNEFYNHVYLDHVPSGPNDLTGVASFWINAPISPSTSITLTTVLTEGVLTSLSHKPLVPAAPLTEQTYTFAAQVDSTGSLNDSGRSNNILSGVQYCTASPDGYEHDNDYDQAKTISIGASQVHNIDKADDEDWVRFQAQAGKTFYLSTSNLATGADTYLYLYDTDGKTLLTSNDDYNDTLASYIEWVAPSTDTYYLQVKHWNPSAEGCGQSYTLAVAQQPDNTATPTNTSVATSTQITTRTATPSGTVPPGSTATRTPPAGATSTPTSIVDPGTCTIEFTDVPSTNNFYEYVRCLACREVLGGYTSEARCPETGAPCFRPGDPITRGQMAKIVSNAAGFDEAHSDVTFTDVGTDHTFYVFIQRLASRGVVGGYNDPSKCPNGAAPCFLPGALVTRGQMSKFVAEAADFNEAVPPDTMSFADVPPTDTFWVYIQRLSGRGVVSGYACGGAGEECPGIYFRPAANVTRGQASKFVSLAFYPNCETPARG